MSFAKNIGKNLSNKYGQNFLIVLTDAIKSASKRAIQKTVEATGDSIGNKIADKITSVSKKSLTENSKKLENDNTNDELEVPKRRYLSPEERQQIIDKLRLV